MTSTVHDRLRAAGPAPARCWLAVAERRRTADRAEAELLAVAVHWVDLHPVTDRRRRRRVGVGGRGRAGRRRHPGDREYAVETLAAALGLSYAAGLRLVSEAVELCFRLPRLWALVQDGRLQAWKARQVAAETTQLSGRRSGSWTGTSPSSRRRNRTPRRASSGSWSTRRCSSCDPDRAAGVEQAALDARGVWFDHRASTATTDLTARLDTLDALDLEASVGDLAGLLGRLGDHRPARRPPGHRAGLARPPATRPRPRRRAHCQPTHTRPTTATGLNGSRGTLYLHVTAADLASRDRRPGREARPRHPRPAAGLDQPGLVLHHPPGPRPRPHRPVDPHDPPAWMRETVILRDRHCVFPGCGIDARSCDLDHIEPYVPPDDGGPPGQTTQRTSPACAGDTTGSRPSPPGATDASPTATIMDRPLRPHASRHRRSVTYARACDTASMTISAT